MMKIMPILMMGKDMTGYPANMRPGLVANKITHMMILFGGNRTLLYFYGLTPTDPQKNGIKQRRS